ncbi:MAG: protein methyltransferase [Hyperthermus sp.]|nr:MAG: protein methyltransferase [Hyperthermus sp.]
MGGECCETVVCEDCYVLVVVDERRRFVFRVRRGGVLGSDKGVLRHDELVGVGYGSWVRLSSGVPALVLKPRLVDLAERAFRRRTQVIYPKDQGLILVMLDVRPGSRVLEIGVGSGFTTAVLAQAVGPEGRVYGYDVRGEMLAVAERNLRDAGLLDRVVLRLADARRGVEESMLDAALVDIPDPWLVLEALENALRPGAPAAFFLPTISQVEKLLRALEERGRWADTRVVEVLLREYEARPGALRPRTTMIAHTGYLVFSRLTSPRPS